MRKFKELWLFIELDFLRASSVAILTGGFIKSVCVALRLVYGSALSLVFGVAYSVCAKWLDKWNMSISLGISQKLPALFLRQSFAIAPLTNSVIIGSKRSTTAKCSKYKHSKDKIFHNQILVKEGK